MVDLHRHSEFSLFDGFGNAQDLAKTAKEIGYTSLGMSEHGTVSGWIKHYQACKEEGIKPILGVECYYQPEFTQDKESYHLCLFAKNYTGYRNINKILTRANEKYFYYKAKVTDDLLQKYHEGIICTSACIAGYASQAIVKKETDKVEEFFEKFTNWFEDDFYVEIQPYTISEKGLQEKVNKKLMQYAKKYDVKCILTSDSHYGKKEDFDTYKKMHEIAKHDKIDIDSTYGERYMPTEKELINRFVKMHSNLFGTEEKATRYAKKMIKNLEEIESKVDDDIISEIKYTKLQYGVDDPEALLKNRIISGMKKRDITTAEYKKRVAKEFSV